MQAGGASQPGWHPDPWNPAQLRWFDGRDWSGSTRPVVAAGVGVSFPQAAYPGAFQRALPKGSAALVLGILAFAYGWFSFKVTRFEGSVTDVSGIFIPLPFGWVCGIIALILSARGIAAYRRAGLDAPKIFAASRIVALVGLASTTVWTIFGVLSNF